MAAERVVAVSGGFDPLHVGHLDYLEAAADHGDRLVVLLNTDAFLERKKGAAFMPYPERARILRALRVVDDVIQVIDGDQTVRQTLRLVRPRVFAKGGDRGPDNTPEAAVCRELGIELVYDVGGAKAQSSSWLINRARHAEQEPEPEPGRICSWCDLPGRLLPRDAQDTNDARGVRACREHLAWLRRGAPWKHRPRTPGAL